MRAPALAFALSFLVASQASAIVIDDFETGPFGLTSPPGQTVGVGPATSSPVHCISPTRRVELTSHGPVDAVADLQITVLDDEVTTVFPDGGGEMSFRWTTPAPVDLTGAGTLGAVAVHLGAAEPGATLELSLEDATGILEMQALAVTGPAIYKFFYTNFTSSLDLEQIAEITVGLRTPGAGDYHFRKIWAKTATSALLKLDSLVPLVVFTSFPAEPLLFDVAMNELISPPEPLADLSMTLMDVDHSVPGRADHRDGSIYGQDDGGPVGLLGHFAAMSLLISDETPLVADPDRFHFRLVIAHKAGTSIAGERLHGTPTVLQEYGRIRMSFEVEYVDAAGSPVGIYTQHDMYLDVWDDQGVELSGFLVGRAGLGLRGAAGPVEIDMSFELHATGPIDYAEPVLVLSTDGAHDQTVLGTDVPEIASGRGPDLVLRAQPTITRGTTELLLSRALATDTSIDVVDVTGRSVRRLALAAGRVAVTWDGRNDSGRPVAAGVYFARTAGAGASSSARMVRLR